MSSRVLRAACDTNLCFAGIERNFIVLPGPQPGCKHPLTGVLLQSMNDSIFEYVLSKLQSSKGNWAAVADGSGVSYRTLEKIARGETKDPGVINIEKLAKYFREQEAA